MADENLTDNKINEIKEVKTPALLQDKNAKEGSFMPLIIFMIFTLIFAGLWDKVPAIKNSVDFILNPTAGALLNWNLNLGMLIVVLIITIITTIVQKYATDQKTLKELRDETKEIQKQMKEFKDHPEKMMELQKKQFSMMPKQMKLSMRAILYTGIPFVLFFRWFNDFFLAAGSPKFLLGLGWFWFYLITTIIIGSILSKWWDVV
jgi:uncharacterized membrane protein (DUF106 family)